MGAEAGTASPKRARYPEPASRGTRSKYEAALCNVPSSEPEERVRLWPPGAAESTRVCHGEGDARAARWTSRGGTGAHDHVRGRGESGDAAEYDIRREGEHENARAVARALSDARVAVLPGQQHVVMYTAPDLFVNEVRDPVPPASSRSLQGVSVAMAQPQTEAEPVPA